MATLPFYLHLTFYTNKVTIYPKIKTRYIIGIKVYKNLCLGCLCGFFSKVLETLEVSSHTSKVSRTLLKKPQTQHKHKYPYTFIPIISEYSLFA